MRARPYAAARAHDGSSGQVLRTILEESRGGGGGGGSDTTDVCDHMRTATRRHPTSTVGGFRRQSVWTYKVLPQSTDPVDVEMFREYVPELLGQNFESEAQFRTCL